MAEHGWLWASLSGTKNASDKTNNCNFLMSFNSFVVPLQVAWGESKAGRIQRHDSPTPVQRRQKRSVLQAARRDFWENVGSSILQTAGKCKPNFDRSEEHTS